MRTILVAGAVLSSGALLVGPAAAGAGIEVHGVGFDAGSRMLELTVTAEDLPPGVGLDPAQTRVTAGGVDLVTDAVVSATATTVTAPAVVLVVDTSGSMHGRPMQEAKAALTRLVSEAPAGVRIGLVSFASAPAVLVRPTLSRPTLLSSITDLQAQGETALFDGVLASLRLLGDRGDRRVVVISDGGDTVSEATLPAVLAATSRSGVLVHTIGLHTDEAVTSVLTRLANAGHGRLHRVSRGSEVTAALAGSVDLHATAVTVRALVPDDVQGPLQLQVRATTTAGVLTAAATTDIAGLRARPNPEGPWWTGRDGLLAGAGAIGLGLLLATLALAAPGSREHRRVHRLLARYTTSTSSGKGDSRSSPIVRTALQLSERVASRPGTRDRLALRLDRAGMTWTPAEWLLVQFGTGFATLLLMVTLGANPVIGAGLGVALAGIGPGVVLNWRGSRRLRAFEERLPDALQMVAGSLSAGYSLAQALDGLVREGSEPMATEIGRALAESRLGMPVEDCLEGVAQRMSSRDFSWVVMAIRVQREVGGNLAGILTTVSATMRERAMLRRHVRGLSAEGRLSAYILVGLPIVLTLYMLLVRGKYVQPMYTTGLGIAMSAAGVVLLALGSLWMSRLVKVDV